MATSYKRVRFDLDPYTANRIDDLRRHFGWKRRNPTAWSLVQVAVELAERDPYSFQRMMELAAERLESEAPWRHKLREKRHWTYYAFHPWVGRVLTWQGLTAGTYMILRGERWGGVTFAAAFLGLWLQWRDEDRKGAS